MRVISQNYVIFSHLLWRLFAKNWVESEFVIDSFLKMWAFFWGCTTHPGYFEGLHEDEQAQVLELLQADQHADAVLMASLYNSARLSRIERWQELRFELRDFWRRMLLSQPFEVDADVLENSWHAVGELLPYEPPPPGAMMMELAELAEFETENGFLRTLEQQRRYQPGSCQFEKVNVSRGGLRGSVPVDCLVLNAETALEDENVAIATVQAWMRFKQLDYYRIASPDCDGSRRVCFYEVSKSTGVYWARDRGDSPLDIKGPIAPQTAAWDAVLSRLETIVRDVEVGLVVPADAASVASPSLGTSQA